MNKIEQEIIKKYVKKHRQKRLLWELGKDDKREEFVWTHFNGPYIFKKECLHNANRMSKKESDKYWQNFNKHANVYFMGESCIGEMAMNRALELAGTGQVCLIYCETGIAYYQGEQEIGSPPRFFLV